MQRLRHHLHHHVLPISKIIFWFTLGGLLGFIFFISFLYIVYQHTYNEKVYPGVSIDGKDFSGQSETAVLNYFQRENDSIANIKLTFFYKDQIATLSAKQLNMGYNANLLATQAISVGRSGGFLSNASLLLQAYINGISLSPTYQYDSTTLETMISPLEKNINIKPVNATFTVANNRVSAFQLATNGEKVDEQQLETMLLAEVPQLLRQSMQHSVKIPIPVTAIAPQVTNQAMDNDGIKDLIGTGTSIFFGSIPSRIVNIRLAASRLNGVLVPPGQVFSFDQSVGDISAANGYEQAYVISGGHTVLGDGGGVCQVSTTMFRAILNAGLPILERHAHDYEVEYYTEDAPLGLDAAIYQPTDDLKFKNDTSHYILIQSIFYPDQDRLTFNFYGTSDGRQASISQPVITDVQPAPAPLYQDDPNLPAGTIQQTDFAAPGAHVSFTRTVTRNGKVLYFDTFNSVYQPWQAQYLRGTKT